MPAEPYWSALVEAGFPGVALAGVQPLEPGRTLVRLADGQQAYGLLFASQQRAANAAAALGMLRAEFDLPVPQLCAADPAGERAGVPALLVRGIEGEPLAALRAQVPDGQLYSIGQQLGQLAHRLHRLAAPHFGELAPGQYAADERGYAQARLERGLAQAAPAGLLNRATAEALRTWLAGELQPLARQPSLTHGGLGPETVLLRRSAAGWKLGGVLGWEHALGWVPAWEHASFWENTDQSRDFALRVGYGTAYDERTQRTYEQVRDRVLLPYRALLLLERMLATHARADHMAAQRARAGLLALARIDTN